MSTPAKTLRGFAAMDADQRFRASSKGGVAVQRKGTGHQWTPEEARAAARIGGLKTQARRRARRADERGA